MIVAQWIITAAVAVSAVSASSNAEALLRMGLMQRQDLSPGSPAYNCHDNCGQCTIMVESGEDVCTDDAFLSDYANCLQCSGPDNQNIWQYYGDSIVDAASACGLSTTPLSGAQADVDAAIAADVSSASASGSANGTATSTTATTGSSTSAPTTASSASASATGLSNSTETVDSGAAATAASNYAAYGAVGIAALYAMVY